MKSVKKIYAAAFLLTLFFSHFAIAADSVWETKKNEDGVEVAVRKVEGSDLLEFNGKTIVDRPLKDVIVFYEDWARMPEWYHQCSESKLLREESPDAKVLYFAIDLPWPVKDRDVVYRRIRSKTAEGAIEFHAQVVNDLYPHQKDRIRMPSVKGMWRFTPLADGRTEVYYQQHGDTGGFIPAWLINKLAVNIPYNSLIHFRAAVEKRKSS